MSGVQRLVLNGIRGFCVLMIPIAAVVPSVSLTHTSAVVQVCIPAGLWGFELIGSTSADSPDLIQNRLDIIFANEDCFLFFCLVTFLSAFTLKGSFMFCSDASVSPSSPQVHGSVLVYLQPGGLQPQPHPSLSCCPQNPSASNSALRDSIQRPAVCLHLQVWQMTA